MNDPNVFAYTASENQIPLSSRNEQQPRTGRPVMVAFSSNYSQWNTDEKWLSQKWKVDEVAESRMERLVNEQSVCLFTQFIERFVIDDDDLELTRGHVNQK